MSTFADKIDVMWLFIRFTRIVATLMVGMGKLGRPVDVSVVWPAALCRTMSRQRVSPKGRRTRDPVMVTNGSRLERVRSYFGGLVSVILYDFSSTLWRIYATYRSRQHFCANAHADILESRLPTNSFVTFRDVLPGWKVYEWCLILGPWIWNCT